MDERAPLASFFSRRPVLLGLTGLARGGLEFHVLNLARALLRRDAFPVSIACHFDAWFAAEARKLGIPVSIVPLKGRFDPMVFPRLARFFKLGNFEVLHAHDKRFLLSARCAALELNIPLVSTYHGWVSTTRWERLTNRLDLRFRLRQEQFIAVSPQIAASLRQAGIDKGSISLIVNAVDPQSFQALPERLEIRARERFSTEDFLVGAVGRLSEEKAPDILLKAFAEFAKDCPKAHLIFAGDGPMRGALKDLVDSLELRDRVRIAGFRSDVLSLTRAFDVFASPSREEGTSQALMEAMWLERPIVATRVGGTPNMIEHSRQGLLVAAENPSELARALAYLWNNPEERERLARSAAEKARREFSIDAMVERTLEVYNRAAKSR